MDAAVIADQIIVPVYCFFVDNFAHFGYLPMVLLQSQ